MPYSIIALTGWVVIFSDVSLEETHSPFTYSSEYVYVLVPVVPFLTTFEVVYDNDVFALYSVLYAIGEVFTD